MLAATSRRESPIGLFEVILRSLELTPQVSEPLRVHAVVVLRAACDIAADPSSINQQTPPEAIELALRLRADTALKRRLPELRSLEAIPPAVARDLLTAFSPIVA